MDEVMVMDKDKYRDKEVYKLKKAREIILKMADGVDPVSGEQVSEGSFLHDPRIVRCMYFVSEVINEKIGKKSSRSYASPAVFVITPEQKSKIELREGRIGARQFSDCVNKVLDLSVSKKLSPVSLNKQLKKMGLLGEESLVDGKKRTVVNDKSAQYGIVSETRSYNGREFQMVLFDEKAKGFLMENLESIMCEDDKQEGEG